MPWLIAFAALIAVVAFFFYRSAHEKKDAQRKENGSPTPTPSPAQQPHPNRDSTAPSQDASRAPITTQKEACQLLTAVLASRTKRPFRGAISELRQEMKEHSEELRSSIDFLRDEVRNTKEYRAGIAENLQDHLKEQGGNLDINDEGIARARRHLEHLDREIAEMQAALGKHQTALQAFRTDKTAFVLAFAAHLLDGTPNPNVARNPDATP